MTALSGGRVGSWYISASLQQALICPGLDPPLVEDGFAAWSQRSSPVYASEAGPAIV